jgi:hypothetical protein
MDGAPGTRRWLLGTHQGAVSKERLQDYLDEFRSSKLATATAAIASWQVGWISRSLTQNRQPARRKPSRTVLLIRHNWIATQKNNRRSFDSRRFALVAQDDNSLVMRSFCSRSIKPEPPADQIGGWGISFIAARAIWSRSSASKASCARPNRWSAAISFCRLSAMASKSGLGIFLRSA